jgi:hypothetical protein
MVVVPAGAAPVGGFTLPRPERIQLPGVRHGLQGAIDGGETDPVALVPKLVVDLLGGPELGQVVQDLVDGGPLSGSALRGWAGWL